MLDGARILVQIPAYRDPQLVHTLDSVFEQAANPDRLRVSVCWQCAPRDRLPHRYADMPGLRIDRVDYRDSRGANWARRRAQRQWRDEPYSLIIDSHLRFARHWDRKLIAMLEGLKSMGVKRPALTCYPPDFDPQTYPVGRSQVPMKIYKEAYIDGVLAHFAGFELPLWRWLKAPIPAQFMALGFLFTEGRFNRDVPFDPNVYFFGDEITTGLRAYCHGYDLFHPHRVLAWHAYDRSTRRCHWEDHATWRARDLRSFVRVRRILSGHAYRDYPLGMRRSIPGYERWIGMPLLLTQSR
ncbi:MULTISPECIES: GlcNAc-transferase family protein [Xanthomonas]|uniref:GlcNAc-transferase family protein n=1 Tax=Xanthomonas TaxID=338 RepID=UPI000E1E8DC9|nr:MULTISPECIES: GlcNAc-transferase family protein [Xanthomonas]